MHAARSLQSRNRLAAKRLKVEIALGLQGVNLELSGDVHSHSYYVRSSNRDLEIHDLLPHPLVFLLRSLLLSPDSRLLEDRVPGTPILAGGDVLDFHRSEDPG